MSLTFAIQALLHRHETYMAEAEEERERMIDSIEKLEKDKRDLEDENQKIVEENRELLDRLEGINHSVSDSDTQIKSLTDTLLATQDELRRLTALASRTTELERQLNEMESEQARLQDNLSTTVEDKVTAVQRWKRAETMLRDLQDQVERIEVEASEERKKHAALVERMERRRAVEKELDGAAGRLKGAAAVHQLSGTQKTPSVVSNFVRDILQDNATLQLGIVELRDMLHASNQEVQNLRERVVQHQPLSEGESSLATPLNEELREDLEKDTSKEASREVHIHHHYHGPEPSARKEKIQPIRRPKKRRVPMTPRAQMRHSTPVTPSSVATILSQTSVTIPSTPRTNPRWSMQSTASTFSAPFSSVPSSPQSAYRPASIFDRMDRGFESSRPTSPESVGWSSPQAARRAKNLSQYSFKSLSLDAPESLIREDYPEETDDMIVGSEQLDIPELVEPEDAQDAPLQEPIIEDDNLASDAPTVEPETSQPVLIEDESAEATDAPTVTPSVSEEDGAVTPEDDFASFFPSTKLRRSASHDSLLSVSGMDIHLTTTRSPAYMSHISPRTVSTSSSTQPIISAESAIANRPALNSKMSSQSILSSFATSGPSDSTHASASDKPTLGSRVGGWVFGRWGMAPVSSKDDSNLENRRSCIQLEPPNATPKIVVETPRSTPKKATVKQTEIRPFGINQKGPIFGLRPPMRTPSQVHATNVDTSLLRESLAEVEGEE